MAKDMSRPGSDESKDGSYRVPNSNKGRENDDEIIAMKNAIEERIRELDALKPSDRNSNLTIRTDNANSQITSNRGLDRFKPGIEEAPKRPPTIQASPQKNDASGCLALLALISFFIALVFPPFWLVILLVVLGPFKSS